MSTLRPPSTSVREPAVAARVPDLDFVSARETDADQHHYFLGERFEGIPWGDAAHTLTPPRQHIVEGAERWLPLRSRTFQRMESLAYGGLGAGWGAGAAVYTAPELRAIGLDAGAIQDAYGVIAERIGLAAEPDDATPWCGAGLTGTQPPLRMDRSIALLRRAYERRREALRRDGLVMGKMPMTVLTQDHGERRATRYTDMEFWTDHGGSVYRPWMTVNALRRAPNFEYRAGRVVTGFRETADHVAIETRALDGGAAEAFEARTLVLGTGTLGTARIVLRSLSGSGDLPLLSNGYCIAPCLHARMLGHTLERERTSLGQLEMFLVKEVPLALADGRALMQALSSAIVLATINHPDHAAAGKRVRRVPDERAETGDALEIEFEPTADERRDNDAAERKILAGLARLGCHALKRQAMRPGSTVHYAGTLPYSDDDRPFTLASDGRLAGTRRVFVADGSGFRHLPGNGLTFTLMANAHRIALGLCGRSHDA